MIASTLYGMIHPFYGSALIAGAILVSFFFALSSRKGFKIFIIAVASLAITGAIALNIIFFRETEDFSNYLFKFGFLQGAEVLLILFTAINVLMFISIKNFEDKNLIKIIIVLLFSLICLNLFIVANNFIMIFSSLALFILSIFQILTLLDSNNTLKVYSRYSLKNYIIRFFLVAVFSLLLIFVGFSLIFGVTDFKNFAQIIQSEKIGEPLLTAGTFIIFSGLYFLLFIFPFQNAYIKLGRRCEGSSLMVIWFLYFPAVVFLLIKVHELLVYFMDKNTRTVSVILIFISALCILAGNIGAIRSQSLRRIFLFLFLSMTGMSVLALAQQNLGLQETGRTLWLIMANMVSCCLFYFPAFAIIYEIERYTGSDLLVKIRGFSRTHRYFGVNLIILLLSFAGIIGTSGYFTKIFYIRPYLGFLSSGSDAGSYGSHLGFIIVSGIISITGILFIAANVIRLVVLLVRKPVQDREIKQLPKFYFPYVLVFTVLVLAIGLIGILGFYGIPTVLSDFDIINIF